MKESSEAKNQSAPKREKHGPDLLFLNYSTITNLSQLPLTIYHFHLHFAIPSSSVTSFLPGCTGTATGLNANANCRIRSDNHQ